jgi:uncharacterized protein (DUF2235 family)
MSKRLVLCCDGTWNTADQQRDGQPCPSNVTKVALGLARDDGEGVEQRVYYQQGVGTQPGERLRGGALGLGLSRNVQEAYRFVVDNYDRGDELFFFGFSRGAYTARSTVGLIRNSGILRRERAGRLGEAYPLYRDRARDIESQLFRRSFSHEPRIRSVGVRDTVGSVGILQPAATAAVSRESGEVAPGPCRPARGQVLKRARSGGPNDLRVMASRATGSGPEQDGR